MLVSGPKLDAGTLKTKWFTEIEKHGALVQVWPEWRKKKKDQEYLTADAIKAMNVVNKSLLLPIIYYILINKQIFCIPMAPAVDFCQVNR